ncbi:MAG: hypothetical protein A2315_16160 [Ignavibacteria bacterium RIFOXYB2_FULL_35_12]|nr:MAG: hypothetical protein A2058_16355 [Ignavibacteria bacterium GWA2_36_19]OGU50950.1 MAG: hypothetical protein A2006_14575 [Ignavibacteria bacterium GWC2_35_8]OGU62052.1 MAG: hypothetical protein A2X60_02350 [Ignavibacteria bacterium GWF2_35_20]OGU79298.1 MAG: hypothetical protein A2254_09270 [Ignavibacteria bacterium RIFOXYA2_FULL_35_9]OGU87832.1 MAG: hypothetical protein A3K31_08125 [Ignavibacteria bacterium RIFOXYA12_FULL_35_25]OGU91183.1 MAG: hypothetical protein A2492_13250 [Ignavibac
MKSVSRFRIFIFFIFLVVDTGCRSESEKNKSDIKFASIYQQSWNESSKNMYKIYLSMRKIDSLSAELNLKFTRKNAQGL